MRSVILSVLVGLLPCAVYAGGINVSMLGSDSGACGAASAPCRTISQAITNASAGDTVLVDSGRYGDLNQDGDLTDPGEENSGVIGKIIVINKAISLVSRNGAGATSIENGSIANSVAVSIEASGVTFGKKRKGFAVRGGAMNSTGLNVDAAVTAASIAGNVVHTHTTLTTIDGVTHKISNNVFGQGTLSLGGSGHIFKDNVGEGAGLATTATSASITIDRNQFSRASGAGFLLQGSGHLVRRNISSAQLAGDGFVCSGTCTGLQLLDNVARLNNGIGFNIAAGSSHVLSGNLADANVGSGFNFPFAVPTGVTFTKNSASGNGGFGIDCTGMSDAMNMVVITNSASIGNRFAGLRVSGGGFASITKSSIYGNDYASGTNCGVAKIAAGGSVFAQSNFWGASAGPGADPADALCNSIATIDATSPLPNEVKVPVQKLP